MSWKAGIELLRGALETLTTLKLNLLLTDFMGALADGPAQDRAIGGGPPYDQSSHRARDRLRTDI